MSTTIGLPEPTTGSSGHRLFRDVNRRVREFVGSGDEEGWFFCECTDERCAAVLRLTGREFDALSDQQDCYAVLFGHEDRERDVVVGRNDRYVLVRCEEPDRAAAAAAGDSD